MDVSIDTEKTKKKGLKRFRKGKLEKNRFVGHQSGGHNKMKSVEEAKQLIIAEKLRHYNERFADIERDLQFFYDESLNDPESLEIITVLQDKVKQLKDIKNKENQETAI